MQDSYCQWTGPATEKAREAAHRVCGDHQKAEKAAKKAVNAAVEKSQEYFREKAESKGTSVYEAFEHFVCRQAINEVWLKEEPYCEWLLPAQEKAYYVAYRKCNNRAVADEAAQHGITAAAENKEPADFKRFAQIYNISEQQAFEGYVKRCAANYAMPPDRPPPPPPPEPAVPPTALPAQRRIMSAWLREERQKDGRGESNRSGHARLLMLHTFRKRSETYVLIETRLQSLYKKVQRLSREAPKWLSQLGWKVTVMSKATISRRIVEARAKLQWRAEDDPGIWVL